MVDPLNSNWLFIKPSKLARGSLQSASGASQTSDT